MTFIMVMDDKEYELFKEHMAKSAGELEEAPAQPLEIQSVQFESMTDEQRKETEAVYKALEDVYCVCNHRKEKHHVDSGFCKHEATRFWAGKIQVMKCECSMFKSKKQQRQEIEAGNDT